MTQATWLVDKSALWRAAVPAVGEALQWRIRRGLLAVSIATEFEIGYSAHRWHVTNSCAGRWWTD